MLYLALSIACVFLFFVHPVAGMAGIVFTVVVFAMRSKAKSDQQRYFEDMMKLMSDPSPALERNEDGTPRHWAFANAQLTLDVDFASRRIVLESSSCTIATQGADGKPQEAHGRARREFPLLTTMSARVSKDTEMRGYHDVVTGTAYTNQGPVTVTGQGAYHAYEASTGFGSLTLALRPLPPPTVTDYGYVSRPSNNGETVTVTFPGKFDTPTAWALESQIKMIDKEIMALAKAEEASLKQAHDAAAAERKAREDEALKARQAATREKAVGEWRQLKEEAGVTGDFVHWNYDNEGRITSLLAVDRSGRAIVREGASHWHGELRGARAQLLQEGQGQWLELELPDPAYEREHLRKRRLTMLRGAAREQLLEWSDRINILGAPKAAE